MLLASSSLRSSVILRYALVIAPVQVQIFRLQMGFLPVGPWSEICVLSLCQWAIVLPNTRAGYLLVLWSLQVHGKTIS